MSKNFTSTPADGVIHPPIDDVLGKSDSKYALVIYAAKRARQINAYYSQLDENMFDFVGPLVETTNNEKSLSIALREINEDKLISTDKPGSLTDMNGGEARPAVNPDDLIDFSQAPAPAVDADDS